MNTEARLGEVSVLHGQLPWSHPAHQPHEPSLQGGTQPEDSGGEVRGCLPWGQPSSVTLSRDQPSLPSLLNRGMLCFTQLSPEM